ncbi:Uncharacterised protein [Klebsiella pneumoniae]|uniref:TonB-dependent receptor n=1 Tax=Klebsiella pneumoniae TaxID=573 RepID=A0A378A1F3_KLEPN|nr:Uncharacterised protein [Klebsiella pneumoniae]
MIAPVSPADLWQGKERGDGLTRGLTLATGVAVPTPPNPKISWNPPWELLRPEGKRAHAARRGRPERSTDGPYAAAGISKSDIDTLMGVPQIVNSAGDFNINYGGVSDRTDRKSAEAGLKGKARTGAVGHQFALNATYYHEDYLLRGYRNFLPQNW